MHSWCDNTGAESAANKMFTTAWPLAAFTPQRLALLSSFTGIHLDVQHIAGPKHEDADYLSRWLEHTPLAARWKRNFRRRVSLRQLWHAGPQISISPPSWKPDFPLLRRGTVNHVAQFHLVELMRDLGSLAVCTFGPDMQIHCCFKVFLVCLHLSDLHFPPENKKEVVDGVTASIPFSSLYILRSFIYLLFACIKLRFK